MDFVLEISLLKGIGNSVRLGLHDKEAIEIRVCVQDILGNRLPNSRVFRISPPFIHKLEARMIRQSSMGSLVNRFGVCVASRSRQDRDLAFTHQLLAEPIDSPVPEVEIVFTDIAGKLARQGGFTVEVDGDAFGNGLLGDGHECLRADRSNEEGVDPLLHQVFDLIDLSLKVFVAFRSQNRNADARCLCLGEIAVRLIHEVRASERRNANPDGEGLLWRDSLPRLPKTGSPGIDVFSNNPLPAIVVCSRLNRNGSKKRKTSD